MNTSSETPTLAAEAYNVVRQRILHGELTLGQSISRRKLAAELGMSFLPVSEALLRLEAEGLLESRPRAGTRVRIPTREDVRGHFIVREALEVQAALLFTQMATAAERRELKKLAARVDALAVQPERTLFYAALHHKLHRRIAQCTRCAPLSHAIEQTHVLASIWLGLLRQPSPTDPTRRHQDLVEALTNGTREEAAEAMRQHVAVGMERTLEVLKPYFKIHKASAKTFFRSEKKQRLQQFGSAAAALEVRYQNA
jgi:DNA-binding GntR family transcriptional regulator